MQRLEIIRAISEFMENSAVDPESKLYQNADAALLAIMTGNIEEEGEA